MLLPWAPPALVLPRWDAHPTRPLQPAGNASTGSGLTPATLPNTSHGAVAAPGTDGEAIHYLHSFLCDFQQPSAPMQRRARPGRTELLLEVQPGSLQQAGVWAGALCQTHSHRRLSAKRGSKNGRFDGGAPQVPKFLHMDGPSPGKTKP